MEQSDAVPAADTGPRRVQAVVALRLLEVMRDMDLPGEVLEEEDPTRTIPRRFGLSDVVERQIRQFRDDVRRRVRLSDHDVSALFRFVIRRPDGAQVFHRVGRLLAEQKRPSRVVRLLPDAITYGVARRRAGRLLKRLFGRPVGGFGRGPFVVEGRALFFIAADPGGDACHLLSGLAEEVLDQTFGGGASVRHTSCQGRGDDLCRWEGSVRKEAATLVPQSERSTTASGDEGAVDAEDAEILDHRPSG